MSSGEVCGAEKSDGTRCQSPIVGDVGKCPAHRDGGSEEMSKRGQAGARVSRARRDAGGFDAADELPPLEDIDAVREWSEIIGRATAEGRISEKRANSLSRLLRQARQALEADAAEEIQELEESIAELREEVQEPSWKA